MKIIRMYDREERGGYQFAVVEVRSFPFFIRRERRVGKRQEHRYFAFLDNGEFTPGNECEDLWNAGTERPETQEQRTAKRLQAAYLVGCDQAKESD